MTGAFDKIAKKVKNEVTGTEKRRFWLHYLKTLKKFTFWGPVISILTLAVFSEYIGPSGHFVFYEIFCSSNFFGRTSPRCCSRGSPGGWIKISFLQKL